jgi:hypothetical protein
MAEITVPDQDLLVNKQWIAPVPNVAVNRSEWSGRSNSWRGPGQGVWRVNCQVRTRSREVEKMAWRLFWQQITDRSNYFKVRRACSQLQGVDINPSGYIFYPGGTGAKQCSIGGMESSVRNLKAGQLVTLIFASGRAQLNMLASDLTANSSGIGIATFIDDLAESAPGGGAVAELNNPYALFRLTNFQDPIDESSGLLNISIQADEYV